MDIEHVLYQVVTTDNALRLVQIDVRLKGLKVDSIIMNNNADSIVYGIVHDVVSTIVYQRTHMTIAEIAKCVIDSHAIHLRTCKDSEQCVLMIANMLYEVIGKERLQAYDFGLRFTD